MDVRAALLLLLLVACSNNGAKREDGAMPEQPQTQKPAAKVQKVYLETPRGELAVTVEVVDTWPKIEKGLMYREFLAPDAGMLFKMGDVADHAFFMKNTLIPLDMMFITRELTVAGIVENAEPRTLTLRRVGVPSLYVLEVNGGYARSHGVTAGAKVRFENITP
jgi:uncharacterized membrane protein (UPF0127 family)